MESKCWTSRTRLRQGYGKASETWSLVAAGVVAAFYLITSIYIASHRRFYFDEILTASIARLPNLVTIWTALGHGADGQPPFHYMVARVFCKLSGRSEVAVRLPSALAVAAGLLITFDCARRLTDGLHGLIGLSLVTCSFVLDYGCDARPYAMYFMLGALALWVWTCTSPRRLGLAICFGAIFFVGVAVHYYFFLCVVPYALWEVSNWKPWQPPSPKLIAGIAGLAASIALLSPLILSFSQGFSASLFRAHVSVPELMEVFSPLFPGGLFFLALIAVWIVLVNRQDASTLLQPMQSGESVSWLFLCIPLAGFVAGELKTHNFAPRYFIAVVPGVAVAFSCCVWRHFPKAFFVSLGIFLILAAGGVRKQLWIVRHPDMNLRLGNYLSFEDTLRLDGKQFSVFSNPFFFLSAQYYSKNECILLVPSGFKQEPNQARYLPLRLVLGLSHYYPLRVGPYEFNGYASETALIQPTPEVLNAVKQAGFEVEVRFSTPLEVVYLKPESDLIWGAH